VSVAMGFALVQQGREDARAQLARFRHLALAALRCALSHRAFLRLCVHDVDVYTCGMVHRRRAWKTVLAALFIACGGNLCTCGMVHLRRAWKTVMAAMFIACGGNLCTCGAAPTWPRCRCVNVQHCASVRNGRLHALRCAPLGGRRRLPCGPAHRLPLFNATRAALRLARRVWSAAVHLAIACRQPFAWQCASVRNGRLVGVHVVRAALRLAC